MINFIEAKKRLEVQNLCKMCSHFIEGCERGFVKGIFNCKAFVQIKIKQVNENKLGKEI